MQHFDEFDKKKRFQNRRVTSFFSLEKTIKYLTVVVAYFPISTLCSVNDVTEGSTQEAHMCAPCVLPRKVDKMV